jgi:hypothetical protein
VIVLNVLVIVLRTRTRLSDTNTNHASSLLDCFIRPISRRWRSAFKTNSPRHSLGVKSL